MSVSISFAVNGSGFAQQRQVLEENRPELQLGRQISALPDTSKLDPGEASSQALGVNLRGIRVVGEPDAIRASSTLTSSPRRDLSL